MSRHPAQAPYFIVLFAGLLLCSPEPTRAADKPAAVERVQKIALHGPAGKKMDHAIFDSKHQRLLVGNLANDSLDLIDLKTGKLHREVGGQAGIHGVAFASDLDRIFAGLDSGACRFFECGSGKQIKSVKLDGKADNLRYDPHTGKVYVSHTPNSLAVIDGKSGAVVQDLGMPGFVEGFEIEQRRPRLYACVPSLSEVVVLDTRKNEVLRRYPLRLAGENYALAIDEANHRLFVGCRKGPLLVVMDSETGGEISTAPLADGVDDVLFDAKRKRIYASCGSGALVVLRQRSADRYEELDRVRTAKMARTACLVPETGRVYVVVPRQEGSAGPEIWVYQPKP